ncbi:BURP domain-containing protein 3-like [Typha angustifolia]|uniref:BURP domain-containing protein 3-like n=1 Tax=Typha angustifolia TaxID=59011 RepID=UPI003C301F00
MDRLLPLLSFLLLALAVSHAAVPPQVYWHSVLPNTPMPSAITDLLTSRTLGHKQKVIFGASSIVEFKYNGAATETQRHEDPNVALFFLEKDLHPGAKMTLHFTKTTSSSAFIPRTAANSIPFSSAKLPQILNYFSIQPNSIEAEAIKKILLDCEEPAAKGEKKYCATSLESMVEFSTSSLGTHNVLAVSTTVGKEETPKQQYTITAGGVQRMAGDELVACHAETYAYAVFYCHLTKSTKAYKVKMVGNDGTSVEAVAVCHTDTAGWNPKHLAFQVLNVKPGTVPICHFMPQGQVVWIRSS